MESHPADGWLYHSVHTSFNFVPKGFLRVFTRLVFLAENFYVSRVRPLLGLRPSEKYFAYSWVLNILDKGTGRILDVGCGDSLLFSELLRRGYQAYAIDLSRHSVARHPEFRFVRGNICCAPFASGVFDWIIAISTLEHIGQESKARLAVMELSRLLKDTGSLLVTMPLCGDFVQRAPRMQGFLAQEFTVIKEEYAIARRGQRHWNQISREEAAKINPESDVAVVHLTLRKQGAGSPASHG